MSLQDAYEDRLDRLRDALRHAGVEFLWVEPSQSFRYLTGRAPISLERPTGLIVAAAGDDRMVVPLMLSDELAGVAADVFTWTDDTGPEPAIAAATRGMRELHVQGSLTVSTWDLLRRAGGTAVTLAADVVGGLRALKDAVEIDALGRSAALTDEVMAWAAGIDVSGLTEVELAGRIQMRYFERGATPTDFPLVASGAHAAMPHYAGGETAIDPAEPLLLDFGCAVDGYWSDLTRVVFPPAVEGRVEEVYAVVCAAYDAAFAAVAPGVPCEEVDRAARSVIEHAGFGREFVHRTGHGIGLDMHEEPYIRAGNAAPLEVGHVFSIEPGIYLRDDLGLRYENVVYVADEGAVAVNGAPRRLARAQ